MRKREETPTKNEWEILKICWAKGEVPARIIYEETLKERKRAYMTIKTTLDIMVKKGYLKNKRLGPIWLYRPAISRAKALAHTVEHFVSNILDNTIAPVVTHFVKNRNLKPEDIAALEELIKQNKES